MKNDEDVPDCEDDEKWYKEDGDRLAGEDSREQEKILVADNRVLQGQASGAKAENHSQTMLQVPEIRVQPNQMHPTRKTY